MCDIMAERKVTWSDDGKGCLTITNKSNEKDFFTFNLVDLFPEYDNMTPNQKYIVEFGSKQALADDFAGIVSGSGKIASAEETWKGLVSGIEKTRKKGVKTLDGFRKALGKAAVKKHNCKKYLANYIALDDEGKRFAAKQGVNRTRLEKEAAAANKAFEKAFAAFKEEAAK